MKKFFIRSKGDQHYGWGNVVRQILIARYLISKKNKVFFFVEADTNLSNFLSRLNINFIKLRKGISTQQENRILEKFGRANISIIETLLPSIKLQTLYSKLSEKLIIYDDLLNGKYLSDILISCQNLKINKNQILNKKLKFYRGYEYFPINKIYKNKEKLKKIIIKYPKKLNIVLGGSDYKILYIKIAKALKKFSNLKIKMIISKKNFFKCKNVIKKFNKEIDFLHPQQNIIKFFNDADILIVGGGYTKIEATFAGKPFFIICTHFHQNKISKNLAKIIGCKMINYNPGLSIKLLEKRIKELLDWKFRKKIFKNIQKIKPDGLKKLEKLL